MPVSIDIACRTLAYYDVANLAQKITAPKTIVVTPVSAHWRFEETNRKSIEWMKKRIN